MSPPTKRNLIEVGLHMLLERGCNGLGIEALLSVMGVPRGPFYDPFRNKEDPALQMVDAYTVAVHTGLEACLGDPALSPLGRSQAFFEGTRKRHQEEACMGCLLGS